MKDVQCYGLFGGIAPKNQAFSFFHFHICSIFTLLAYTIYKFRVQALPFSMETTIVIPMTLSIYSSVTNVIWNLHLIDIKQTTIYT